MDTEADTNTIYEQELKEETSFKRTSNKGPEQERIKHSRTVRDVDGIFTSTLGENGKKERPPPINIYNQDPKNLIKTIKNSMKDAKFYIKRVNDLKHVLI